MTQGWREHNNHETTVVRSLADGQSVVHKFGRNEAVSTSVLEDVWSVGGVYTFPTVAQKIVAVSSSANDTSGGTGARVITIMGLDENFNEVSEDITMNGQSETVQTSASYIRINRAIVKESGIYSNVQSGPNAGDITIQYSGSTVLAEIQDGVPSIGQTQSTIFTVPVGKTAYITAVTANVDSNQTATVYAWQRPNADTVAAPFSAKRNLFILNGVSGVNPLPIKYPMGPFYEKTDLWFSALGGAALTSLEVDYEILLVPN
jgi:hypothetical protein